MISVWYATIIVIAVAIGGYLLGLSSANKNPTIGIIHIFIDEDKAEPAELFFELSSSIEKILEEDEITVSVEEVRYSSSQKKHGV